MKHLVLIFLALTFLACQNSSTKIFDSKIGGQIVLQHNSDTSNTLCHILEGDTISQWALHYSVYKTDYGDITQNGENEIIVGVTKQCKYWRDHSRRLFIFKLYQNRLIRPLWLGSRVGCPLVDFKILRDSVPARILTTETINDSTFHAMYRHKGFGLKFEKYVKYVK